MDILIEFIFELIFEIGYEIATNEKVSKFVRYPILFLYLTFFILIISLLIFLGISLLDDSVLAGILFFALGTFFLIGGFIKIKKKYIEKIRSKTNG